MYCKLIASACVVVCISTLPAAAANPNSASSPLLTAPEPAAVSVDNSPLAPDVPAEPTSPALAVSPNTEAAPSPSIDPSNDGAALDVRLGKHTSRKSRSYGMCDTTLSDAVATATGYSTAQLSRANRIANDALNYRGAPYVWGGNGRGGVFDCSGFTQYLYARRGVKLPHSAKMQYAMGHPVGRDELQSGDLIFFNTERGPLTHVGMYLGNGKFIHAANPRRGVTTSRIQEAYYAKRFAGARRLSS